jgi:hypothetical protein
LEAAKQVEVTNAATHVMTEPHWMKLGITPLMAVKIASHRSKRKSIAAKT